MTHRVGEDDWRVCGRGFLSTPWASALFRHSRQYSRTVVVGSTKPSLAQGTAASNSHALQSAAPPPRCIGADGDAPWVAGRGTGGGHRGAARVERAHVRRQQGGGDVRAGAGLRTHGGGRVAAGARAPHARGGRGQAARAAVRGVQAGHRAVLPGLRCHRGHGA